MKKLLIILFMFPGFSNGMERPGITHIIREPQTPEEATKELGNMLINAKFSTATANTNYENNLVEKVKKFLKLGANPNGTQRVGEKYCKIDMSLCGSAQLSFLMYAIVLGYPKIVRLLLDAGANPNFKALTRPLAGPTEFTTPLLQASKSPTSTETISLLLAHGANPNITTAHGRSPLMNAIALGSIDTIRQLLKHDADIDFATDYETALSVAVAGNDLNIMRLLLENADPNITDKSGVTALMYAAVLGNVPMVQLLLENGANPKLKDTKDNTALDFAQKNQNAQIIQLLNNPPPLKKLAMKKLE